jgi:hypothetical protein
MPRNIPPLGHGGYCGEGLRIAITGAPSAHTAVAEWLSFVTFYPPCSYKGQQAVSPVWWVQPPATACEQKLHGQPTEATTCARNGAADTD